MLLQVQGKKAPKTHALKTLFDLLPQQDREILREYYDDFQTEGPWKDSYLNKKGATLDKFKTRDKFLENLDGDKKNQHSTGSIDWRYFLVENISNKMPSISIDLIYELVEGCARLIEALIQDKDKAREYTYSMRCHRKRTEEKYEALFTVYMNRPDQSPEEDQLTLLWGPDNHGRYDAMEFNDGKPTLYFTSLSDLETKKLKIIDKRYEMENFDAAKALRSIGLDPSRVF